MVWDVSFAELRKGECFSSRNALAGVDVLKVSWEKLEWIHFVCVANKQLYYFFRCLVSYVLPALTFLLIISFLFKSTCLLVRCEKVRSVCGRYPWTIINVPPSVWPLQVYLLCPNPVTWLPVAHFAASVLKSLVVSRCFGQAVSVSLASHPLKGLPVDFVILIPNWMWDTSDYAAAYHKPLPYHLIVGMLRNHSLW